MPSRGALILALTTLACGPAREAAPPRHPMHVRAMESPAPSGSSIPMLTTGRDGSLLLGWTEPTDGGHRIRFAVRRGGRWSETRTIAEGKGFFVNWADTPSLLSFADGRLAAQWLVKTGPRGYDYEVRLAVSSDEGVTWSTPVVPHRDGVDAEHGFVSLFEYGDRLGLVWLDGRAMGGGHTPHSGGATALRYSTLSRDGTLSAEQVIDERVCDCCQTAAAVVGDSVVVAYRDRGDDERRDISFARLKDGQWSAPAELGRDGWVVPACPVNGPQLAARGERIAAAWFSSPGGQARVRYSLSTDAGATFLPPVDLDTDGPLGRVDVAWLSGGEALVTWMRPLPPRSGQIVARVLTDGRTPGELHVIAETGGARSSGFPRLVALEDSAYVAWTDPSGQEPQVRLAEISRRGSTSASR